MFNYSRWILWLIGIAFILSCSSSVKMQKQRVSVNPKVPIDSIQLRIHAIDLTEDMSSLSSKNDEVSVFAYVISDSATQLGLLFSKAFTMTEQRDVHEFVVGDLGDVSNKSITLIFIERDTDHGSKDIEVLITQNYYKILEHYRLHSNFGIEKYIMDNDIIGVKRIDSISHGMHEEFEFNGFFKLDKYRYRVSIVTK